MGDHFEMLVDADVRLEAAETTSRMVIEAFFERGLIAGELTGECVLGGKGYRPGPAVEQLYQPEPGESTCWGANTCGVEPRVGRDFNQMALCEVCEGIICPSCRVQIDLVSDPREIPIADAIEAWYEQSGKDQLKCPDCAQSNAFEEWDCKPPFGFGTLSFRFWNWPPLRSSQWRINIEALTGHKIVYTYGMI